MIKTNIKTDFHGIVLYNIELNGCLNGIYTNKPNKGEILNEIAKPTFRVQPDIQELHLGEYDVQYFELDNSAETCKLFITRSKKDNLYYFVWKIAGARKNKFEGIGYKMNSKQIAVHYWNV